MARLTPHDTPGVPDADNPEWTADDLAWAVRPQDFGGDLAAVASFLARRAEIVAVASRLGIPKETFLSFAPNRPGFEKRVATAFSTLAESAGLAAE